MATNNEEDKKLMDVAPPGEAKPETGSKPMVVGHKFLSSDPAMKETPEETSDEPKTEEAINEEAISPAKKIVLEPISDNLKKQEDEPAEANTEEEEKKEVEKAEASESNEKKIEPITNGDNKKNEDTPEESAEPEAKKTAEELASEEDEAKLKQEARIKEIIKSKEYFVPVKVKGASAASTFIITFILVVVLGMVIIAGLIDAEILDFGVELPFDFL